MQLEDIKLAEQKDFPYLEEFKKKFTITEGTVFVFNRTIFVNGTIPPDIMLHEFKHILQQEEIGAAIWIEKYLEDKDFRLEQELEAYIFQLRKVKEITNNNKNEIFNIQTECAKNISSPMYGSMISYKKAWDYFEENL